MHEAALKVAPVVREALLLYRAADDPNLQAYAKTIIYFMCRKMEHFAVPRVSRGAGMEANGRGIELRKLAWKDQPRYDPERATFHFDHIIPVADMRDRVLNLTGSNEEDVAEVLASAAVAWILKREDCRLTKLGYRSGRRDWQRCYEEAGIELEP